MGALFLVFNLGHFSESLSQEKLVLQSGVRLAMDWITKDMRQAISWNIASDENAPAVEHLKFNLWAWNAVTNTWDLSSDYVEYNYDSDAQKITRSYYNDATHTTMTLEFGDILEPPFYTYYVGTGDPANVLNKDSLRNNGVLTVVIKGERALRNVSIPFSLKSEVRIRNGI